MGLVRCPCVTHRIIHRLSQSSQAGVNIHSRRAIESINWRSAFALGVILIRVAQ
jgi:hypothetical protein